MVEHSLDVNTLEKKYKYKTLREIIRGFLLFDFSVFQDEYQAIKEYKKKGDDASGIYHNFWGIGRTIPEIGYNKNSSALREIEIIRNSDFYKSWFVK